MQKDSLTKEKIKLDYAVQRSKGWGTFILACAVLAALLALIAYMCSFFGTIGWVFAGVVAVIGGLFILMPLFVWLDDRKMRRVIANEQYYVTTDRLVRLEEKHYEGFRRRRLIPHTLYFASYGRYYAPLGEQYHASGRFQMSDDGLSNTSILGDTFYLVIAKNKQETILLAYNTKMFDRPPQA